MSDTPFSDLEEDFEMNATELVEAAMKVIDDAHVPPEVKPVAFAKVFDFIAQGTPSTPAPPGGGGGDAGGGGGNGTAPLEKIASKLGVDTAAVEQVFDHHEGELDLSVHPDKIDSARTRGTTQIALLLAAGRQAIELDESGTPLEVVRAAAEHFKRYDPANFSTTINGLKKVMNVRGSGRDRMLKMTSPAWVKASELVRKLTDA